MRAWAIYYDDGSVIRDTDCLLANLPCDGVIIIAQADDVCGREILHLKDYYYWEQRFGRWFGCDRYGLEDYLRRPGWRKILAGRNTDYPVYSALFDRACNEPGMSAKSARLVNEAPKVSR